jgi:hypothetical protein
MFVKFCNIFKFINVITKLCSLDIVSALKGEEMLQLIVDDIGGGYLVGKVDSEGEFSGPSLGFVYPDLLTALLGSFQSQLMINAQAVTIIGKL